MKETLRNTLSNHPKIMTALFTTSALLLEVGVSPLGDTYPGP